METAVCYILLALATADDAAAANSTSAGQMQICACYGVSSACRCSCDAPVCVACWCAGEEMCDVVSRDKQGTCSLCKLCGVTFAIAMPSDRMATAERTYHASCVTNVLLSSAPRPSLAPSAPTTRCSRRSGGSDASSCDPAIAAAEQQSGCPISSAACIHSHLPAELIHLPTSVREQHPHRSLAPHPLRADDDQV